MERGEKEGNTKKGNIVQRQKIKEEVWSFGKDSSTYKTGQLEHDLRVLHFEILLALEETLHKKTCTE